MKSLTENQSANVKKFNQTLKDAVDYCFFDRDLEERALMLIEVRTKNQKEIHELSTLFDEHFSELFVRLTLSEMMLKTRIAEEFKDSLLRGES